MQIALIASDNFTDLYLILHWDILSRVKTYGKIENWSVKILGTQETHLSSLGLPIPTHGHVRMAAEADGIILCSGRGTRNLLFDEEYLLTLGLNPEKQFIGAQCSGSLILGALGFLRNVMVTAYPPILDELKNYEAIPVNEPLVVMNKIATASNCLGGQYLSRWLIESLAGKEVANKVMLTVTPLAKEAVR